MEKRVLNLDIMSEMQHEWEGGGQDGQYSETAGWGSTTLPEVPSSLQVIDGADLSKVKELGRGQFGSVCVLLPSAPLNP